MQQGVFIFQDDLNRKRSLIQELRLAKSLLVFTFCFNNHLSIKMFSPSTTIYSL